MSLTACSTTKTSLNKLKLPELPIAGEKVGKEFVDVCKNEQCEAACKDSDIKCKVACRETKCKEIYAWLVKLHDFRRDYNIYREELMVNSYKLY
jgi:hypothetical protein